MRSNYFVIWGRRFDLRYLSSNLRAVVLGFNDGLVSNFGLIMGVLGASQPVSITILTGVAGLVAGSLSMAVGEYTSVRTQLEMNARARGDREPADILATGTPWGAASLSVLGFSCGAVIPLLPVLIARSSDWVVVVLSALVSLLALAIMGGMLAHISHTSKIRGLLRMVLTGSVAAGITFLIGWLIGLAIN